MGRGIRGWSGTVPKSNTTLPPVSIDVAFAPVLSEPLVVPLLVEVRGISDPLAVTLTVLVDSASLDDVELEPQGALEEREELHASSRAAIVNSGRMRMAARLCMERG